MARFKLGFGMADIRGKIGNYIYSIQKTGVSTIRQCAQAVSNPMSDDQAAIRCNMAMLSKYWHDTLLPAQRVLWETWASTKPGMGNKDGGILVVIKGNNGIMSGFNAFCMANQWLKSVARVMVSDPPIGLTPPTPPLGVSAGYATGTVTVTYTIPAVYKTLAKVRVWMACHQPWAHRQLLGYDGVASLSITYTKFKGALGQDVAFSKAPGNYIFQMDTVDIDGTKSGPSNVAEVIVT